MNQNVARLALVSIVLAGCASTSERSQAAERAPLGDFGAYHRPVTTRSAEAQRWFDRGLVHCYAFDHAEAIRSFERAAEADPTCAMAHWGQAFAHGPHINNPFMDEASARAAYDAAQRAIALREHASDVERALIDAVAARYAWPAPENRSELDRAFADAMRAAYRAHPGDPDVAAITAESLMDLRPWDLYSKEGEPRPETPEIVSVLERLLASHPDHPAANHYWIHVMETSPTPARAIAAADRLRELVPDAAHLVHMPSHIDVLVGEYERAIRANERAVAADERRAKRTGIEGFYVFYAAHNAHMLAYAAMFAGRSEQAIGAARRVVALMTPEVVREAPDFFDAFVATPLHVLIRFGQWNDVLAEPEPPEDHSAARAFRLYARAVALSALGRVDEAERERELFARASAAVPESRYLGNNTARDVLAVARAMLDGEIAYRKGDHARAFASLREAVALDDGLRYDKPWGWMQPVRHALGALLLEQGRVAEAEAVYREDLARHPNNGWSLHGLAECLRKKGDAAAASEAERAFAAAWRGADVELAGSCFCRTGS
jgi:tetratricopeptide (TPR) repeat protein